MAFLTTVWLILVNVNIFKLPAVLYIFVVVRTKSETDIYVLQILKNNSFALFLTYWPHKILKVQNEKHYHNSKTPVTKYSTSLTAAKSMLWIELNIKYLEDHKLSAVHIQSNSQNAYLTKKDWRKPDCIILMELISRDHLREHDRQCDRSIKHNGSTNSQMECLFHCLTVRRTGRTWIKTGHMRVYLISRMTRQRQKIAHTTPAGVCQKQLMFFCFFSGRFHHFHESQCLTKILRAEWL